MHCPGGPRYFCPTEVETLLGDASKARQKLGWTPQISFQQLVAEMVQSDLQSSQREELVNKQGFATCNYHEQHPATMGKTSKIYVAGHRGLAGSAILRTLQDRGFTNLVVRTHAELDLEDGTATQRFSTKNAVKWFSWLRSRWAVSMPTRPIPLIF